MPQQINTSFSPIDKIDHIKQAWSRIDTITINNIPLEVYSYDPTSKDQDIIFLHNNTNAAESSFSILGNGIEESFISQNPDFKGLARKIYTEYYMTKYEFILSDTTMTPNGLNFWIKLYHEYNNKFNFYLWDNKNKKKSRIKNNKQISDVYGKTKDKHNWRFIIQNK